MIDTSLVKDIYINDILQVKEMYINDILVWESGCKTKFLINNGIEDKWKKYNKGDLGTDLNAKTDVLCTEVTELDITLKEAIIKDETITSLVNYAFYNCQNLSSINCPNIKSIGSDAFSNCQNLSSINCSNVSSLGNSAFCYCSSLISIDCSSITNLQTYSFFGCSSLISLYLPNVTNIYSSSFNYCKKLQYIDFGYSMETIPYLENTNVFDNIDQKVSCYVPDSIYDNWITADVWTDINNVDVIIIKQSERYGDRSRFLIKEGDVQNWKVYENNYFGDSIDIKDKVLSSSYLIDDDTLLNAIIEDPNIKKLRSMSLAHCISLSSVDFNHILSVGDHAFESCSNLISIDLPNVSSIEDSIFRNCISLSSVNLSEISSIAESMFNNCNKLAIMSFPKVESIGWASFTNCYDISSFDFSKIKYVGDNSFEQCSNLISIDAPLLSVIEKDTFLRCYSLSSAKIDNVLSIGRYGFCNCSNLISLDIPKVHTIDYSAFSTCKNLNTISCPSISSIEQFSFYGSNNISSMYFGDDLTSIPLVKSNSFGGGYPFITISCYVPNELYEEWCTAPIWSDFKSSGIIDLYKWEDRFYDGSKFIIDGVAHPYPHNHFGSKLNAKTDILGIGEEDVDSSMQMALIKDDSMTTLDYSSFRSCSNLSSVYCPYVKSFKNSSTFANCSNLISIDISNVSSIGDYAFEYCYSLSSVKCPNAITIGDYTFDRCSSLISLDLPNVSSIGNNAFVYCTNLSSIDLPNVNSISEGAFIYCLNLSSANISNVSSIGGNVFYGCSSLVSIDLPNVSSIGEYTFYECSNLSSIECPNVSSIGRNAFTRCNCLTSLYLPNIISLDNPLFSVCPNLSSIDFGTTLTSVPIVKGNSFGYIGHAISCYIPNDDELYEKWTTAEYWSTFITNKYVVIKKQSEKPKFNSRFLIDDEWIVKEEGSLPKNINIKSEILGKSRAEEDHSLRSVIIEDNNISAFKDDSCRNCYKLSSLTLPHVLNVGDDAFRECSNLISIYLPNVTNVGEDAFNNCYSLSSINLPKLENLCSDTFLGCSNLISIYFPNVKNVGDRACYNCCSLSSIDLPTVASIDGWAFHNCSNLISIILPRAEYVDDAFYNCNNIQNVYMPNVKTLKSEFTNCSGLISIDLPKLLVAENKLFSKCSNLISVSFNNVSELEDGCFYECTKMSSIVFGEDMTSVPEVGEPFYIMPQTISCYVPDDLYPSWINYSGWPKLIKSKQVEIINSFTGSKFLINNDWYISAQGSFGNSLDAKRYILHLTFTEPDDSLKEAIIKDNDVIKLDSYSFNKCYNLSSVKCPNIRLLGTDAFSHCSNLVSIDIPNASSIGSDAFYKCTNLSSIECPSVSSIGSDAFSNCSNLFSIDFGTTMTSVPVVESNSFNDINKKVSCYVPDSIYSNWIIAANWSKLIFDNKVEIIKHGSV